MEVPIEFPAEEARVLATSGFWLWWFLALLVWVAIAFWPGAGRSPQGHSFLLFFICSLFFFPAALIVAYVILWELGELFARRPVAEKEAAQQAAVAPAHAVVS